jgi:hypothetical protein
MLAFAENSHIFPSIIIDDKPKRITPSLVFRNRRLDMALGHCSHNVGYKATLLSGESHTPLFSCAAGGTSS